MTTSITELIKYLKTLPGDTELSVVRGFDLGYGGGTEEVPLSLDLADGNVDYTDLTGNPHVKPNDSRYNKKHLVFGET